ncbi:MAG: hypothetical protein C4331_06470, partial [Meiothermus sp.]
MNIARARPGLTWWCAADQPFYTHSADDRSDRSPKPAHPGARGCPRAPARRVSDLVSRYGGEEFACILPETGLAGAKAVAEQIRQEVLRLAVPHRRSQVAEVVTVSLGVVTARCVQGEPAVYLMALADQQLYAAKIEGR